jgi:hypothetical protein
MVKGAGLKKPKKGKLNIRKSSLLVGSAVRMNLSFVKESFNGKKTNFHINRKKNRKSIELKAKTYFLRSKKGCRFKEKRAWDK